MCARLYGANARQWLLNRIMPIVSADVRDLAVRFTALCHELESQLYEQLTVSGPPHSQLAPLARHLEDLLHALPAGDARHHRYRLVRELSTRLRNKLAPQLEQQLLAEVPSVTEESSLLQNCLANQDFHHLFNDLHAEVSAIVSNPSWATELTAAIAGASGEPPSSSSESEATTDDEGGPQNELDRMLQQELEAELPPFLELPELLSSIRTGDTADRCAAWQRIRAFSAADLLDSDQWHEVLPALSSLLQGCVLDTAALIQVIELYAGMLDEGAPPQRAAVLVDVAMLLQHFGSSSGGSGGGGGGGNGSGGSGDGRGGSGDGSGGSGDGNILGWERCDPLRSPQLLCAQLLCRGRIELANDGIQLPAAMLDSLLDAIFHAASSHSPPPLTHAAPRFRLPTTDLVLCAMDPAASWLSRLLSRAQLQPKVWARLITSGLLAEAEAVARTSLPFDSSTAGGLSATPHLPSSSTACSAEKMRLSDLQLAHSLHHVCVLGIALRYAISTDVRRVAPGHSVAVDSSPGSAYNCAWAASALPLVISRLSDVARQLGTARAPAGGLSAFASTSLPLVARGLGAALSCLVHSQCLQAGVWTSAATDALLQPIATLVTGRGISLSGRGPTADAAAALVDLPAAEDEGAVESRVHAACHDVDGQGVLEAARQVLPALVCLSAVDGGAAATPPLAGCTTLPLLLCRAALALLCAPEPPTSSDLPPSEAHSMCLAREVGAGCLSALCRLVAARLSADTAAIWLPDGHGATALRRPAVAHALLPTLLEASGRVSSAAGLARMRRLAALGMVGQMWCTSCGCSSALLAALLPPLAASLLPPPLPLPDASEHETKGGRPGGRGDQCGDRSDGSGGMPGGLGLGASVLGCTHDGLRQLALAGVVDVRARAFVQAAEAGEDSLSTGLHGEPPPGVHSPLLDALASLSAIYAWSHAMDAAFEGDAASDALRQPLEFTLRRLTGLVPVHSGAVGSAEASAEAGPRHYEESHAAGLLLLNLLAADVHVGLRLRQHFGLRATLVRMRRQSAIHTDGSTAVEEALTAPSTDEEWMDEAGSHVEVPDDAPIIDLNVLCRARLEATLIEWGTPMEWPAATRSLAAHPAHPFEQLGLDGQHEHDHSRCEAPADVGSDASCEERAIAAILASTSSRVQAVSPLLRCSGLRTVLGPLWAQCESCGLASLHADVLDAVPCSVPGGVGADNSQPSAMPEHCVGGARLLLRYVRRAGGPAATPLLEGTAAESKVGQAEGAEALSGVHGLLEFLATLPTGVSTPSGRFDSFAALTYVLLAPDSSVAREVLRALAVHAIGPYVLPPQYCGGAGGGSRFGLCDSPQGALLISLAEELIFIELPEMHAALRRAGLSAGVPIARWLSVHWLNVLPWRSLLCAQAVPLLLGCDWQVYLCVAAIRSLQDAVCRCTHRSSVLILVLQPLDSFDVLAAVPYMFQLRERHGAQLIRALVG